MPFVWHIDGRQVRHGARSGVHDGRLQVTHSSIRKRLVQATLAVPLLYVAMVVVVELSLGVFQPEWWKNPVVITTQNDAGQHNRRVLSALVLQGQLYVGVNHWPRQWYRDVLKRPDVVIERNGAARRYTATQVFGDEYDRVNERFRIPRRWRILTGFPPRHILRLDPSPADETGTDSGKEKVVNAA